MTVSNRLQLVDHGQRSTTYFSEQIAYRGLLFFLSFDVCLYSVRSSLSSDISNTDLNTTTPNLHLQAQSVA